MHHRSINMKLRHLQKETKSKLLTVKVTEEDLETIREKARLYTDGNISEWIRYSSTELLPRSMDLLDHEDEGDNETALRQKKKKIK